MTQPSVTATSLSGSEPGHRVDEVRLTSWEEFERWAEARARKSAVERTGDVPRVVFRGQRDASWALSTTLERWEPDRRLTQREYFDLAIAVAPEITTATSRAWDLPSDWSEAAADRGVPLGARLYPYYLYLRHHGFPSPLLDWTGSHGVAAYFAFAGAAPDAEVAIFAFEEMNVIDKIFDLRSGPGIHTLGPKAEAHQRHREQQSRYTLSLDADSFVPHDADASADRLEKVILPGALRDEVLRVLDGRGVHAHALFGDEDHLMETLAARVRLQRRVGEGS